MNLPCLVTGPTGFLGRHVVDHLVKTGCDVTALGRHVGESQRDIQADLTASELTLNGRTFSTVYHVAGLAHRVPRTGAEGALFFQVNVEGTKNLLRALERTDKLPEAVVLISTVAVYGREEGMQLDETTPRKAIEPYGASKREAEDFLMAWCSRHGVRAGVVRLPLVAGSNAPGNLGAMVGALRKGTYLGIGSGAARRSMVMASDVAQVLPEVARAGGVYNLTDGYHPSFMEFETALANAMGRRAPRRLPLRVARLGARLGDVVQKTIGINVPFTSRTLTKMSSTLTLSDERARKELGWSPSPVLDHARELTKGHESWVAGK